MATTVYDDDGEHPPPDLPFTLGPDLRLDHPGPLTEHIIAATTMPGYPPGGADQRWVPYAFIRSNPPDDPPDEDGLVWRKWDRDLRTSIAVANSRLIWLNGVWPEHAARVELDNAGELVGIWPSRARRRSYVEGRPRPWLTQSEAEELASLLARYHAQDLARPTHGRLPTAPWFAEYVARENYGEVRWMHSITALEALLTTSEERIAAQFKVRFPALARALGYTWVTPTQATRIYAIRSAIVHGAVRQKGPRGRETNELRLKVEEVLRAALRKAIEDDHFRASFDTNETVAARWGEVPPP